MQRKTFGVTAAGKGCCGLTLDWQTGFTLNEGTDGSVIWQFKFSQLRGSSDDGKSKLKLHFQDSDTRVIETKVRDGVVGTVDGSSVTNWISLNSRNWSARCCRASCSACTPS